MTQQTSEYPKATYFDCACHDPAHTLRFSYDFDPEWHYLCVEVYLNDYRSFWKRLWYGLRYIAGFKTKYGAFGSWEMKEGDVDRLQQLLDQYRASKKT